MNTRVVALCVIHIACRAAPGPVGPLQRGDRAPDLWIELGDRRVSLRGPGQAILLDFWDRSCTPCLRAVPELARLRAHHAAFEIISVTPEESSAELRAFVADHAITWSVASDSGPVHAAFRVDRYPSYFLIDADGMVVCAPCSLAQVDRLLGAPR